MRKLLPILAILVLTASSAHAVKVADITRISGQRTNTLIGIGLVTGLHGTGDGGDYLPAIRPLAVMLGAFANETEAKELGDVQNVALVGLSVMLPKDGVHAGDKLDVHVTSWGKASSLKGGSLVSCPLKGPMPEPAGKGKVWAMAQGLVIVEDASSPTSGVIKGGCVMEQPFKMHYVVEGKLTLILEDQVASWTTSGAIAQVINDSEANGKDMVAVATDPTTVEVMIPTTERERPDGFISRVQRLSVPERLLNNEARVLINDKTHTMIITGDVEISPAIISHMGLTITTTSPRPEPTIQNPGTTRKEFIAVDTTNTAGAKLQDLVAALDQLKVPAEERITIIKELHKSGKLHAKLITEE
jgi:flagellar P-ring protein precursor FlgI